MQYSKRKDRLIENQDARIKEDQPKVIFANSVIASENSILIRDLAKLICQNGYNVGQNKLYAWMRHHGYICKNSTEPTQKAMNLGLFEVVVRTIETADAPPKTKRTTKVTGKGQVYFINKFCHGTESEYCTEPMF